MSREAPQTARLNAQTAQMRILLAKHVLLASYLFAVLTTTNLQPKRLWPLWPYYAGTTEVASSRSIASTPMNESEMISSALSALDSGPPEQSAQLA